MIVRPCQAKCHKTTDQCLLDHCLPLVANLQECIRPIGSAKDTVFPDLLVCPTRSGISPVNWLSESQSQASSFRGCPTARGISPCRTGCRRAKAKSSFRGCDNSSGIWLLSTGLNEGSAIPELARPPSSGGISPEQPVVAERKPRQMFEVA